MQTFGVKTKTGWHRNIEVSKDWCFSRLATPRFVKRRNYIRVCKMNITMGVTCCAGTAYPSGVPVFTHVF